MSFQCNRHIRDWHGYDASTGHLNNSVIVLVLKWTLGKGMTSLPLKKSIPMSCSCWSSDVRFVKMFATISRNISSRSRVAKWRLSPDRVAKLWRWSERGSEGWSAAWNSLPVNWTVVKSLSANHGIGLIKSERCSSSTSSEKNVLFAPIISHSANFIK